MLVLKWWGMTLNQATSIEDKQYQKLLDLSPIPVAIHSKGVIVYANYQAAKLMGGKSSRDLIGQPVISFVHPEYLEIVKERIKQIYEKRRSFTDMIEEKLIRLDGKIIEVEITSMMVTFHREPAILVTIRDITQTKQAEEAIQLSEQKFRALIENSSDVVVLTDIHGQFLYISPSIERAFGYRINELLHKNAFLFIDPQEKKRLLSSYKNITLKPGKTNKSQLRVRHKNGDLCWVEITTTNLLNDPAVKAIVSNIRDITIRRKNEERVTFFEKSGNILISSLDFETTLKNIGTVIVPEIADYYRIAIVDDNYVIKEISFNHADPKKIKLVTSLYEQYKDNPQTSYGVQKILLSGKPELISKVTKEYLAPFRKSSPLMVKLINSLKLKSYIGVPLKARGKIIGALTLSSTKDGVFYTKDDLNFAVDLARLIALALDNARLFNKQQEAIAHRNNFISIASHELKTPVTSIKAFTQVLERHFAKRGDLFTSQMLDKMDQQINKLTLLISDLLDVSRIEAGKLQLRSEKYSLDELVKEVVEEVQRTADEHKIVIKGSIKQTLVGDRERIGQVLTNFLTNAIKYSPSSQQIIVTLKNRGHKAICCVQDFGIGIAKLNLPRVFERFFRATGQKEDTYPGLGLGLHICAEIIKRQHGRIWVKSEVGKGSTFYFSLPIAD